jgi:protein SCO1/2
MSHAMKTSLVSLSCLLLSCALLCASPVHAAEVQRSYADYTVPDVTLVDQDGAKVKVKQLLEGAKGKPVFVQFVFTSCTTICSLLGAVFSNFQKKFGPGAKDIRFVSVSIDPDHDTPDKLKKFLGKFDAGPNWTFVTGDRADIKSVGQAFDAWVENKMTHTPLTFMWSPAEKKWLRLNGFIGAGELVDEYNKALVK